MRFVKFRQQLNDIHSASPVDMVVFEEVRRHAGTDAAHVYGGLMAVLTEWCEVHKIPYEGISVGTIKKFATGKGNADKKAMIDWAFTEGFSPIDDNEADALALHACKTAELSRGSGVVTSVLAACVTLSLFASQWLDVFAVAA